MYTTTFAQKPAATSFANQTIGTEIPHELLSTLIENAERQIAEGEFISQYEMEKLAFQFTTALTKTRFT